MCAHINLKISKACLTSICLTSMNLYYLAKGLNSLQAKNMIPYDMTDMASVLLMLICMLKSSHALLSLLTCFCIPVFLSRANLVVGKNCTFTFSKSDYQWQSWQPFCFQCACTVYKLVLRFTSSRQLCLMKKNVSSD